MTVIEIPELEQTEEILTLPDLPDEYFNITIIDEDEKHIEETMESYSLAISDVTEECILNSKKLTNDGNDKEIFLLELSASFSAFSPGDTIGIIPKNREKDVQKLLSHLGIIHLSRKKCLLNEKCPSFKKNFSTSFLNKVTTLNHIFTHCLDIQCIPKKSLIRVLSEFTKDVNEKKKLEELCSKERSDLYLKNILELHKTFLDLLLMFPSCCPPVTRLIENLPTLLPRPYSIASSPTTSSDKIKIVFSVTKTHSNREGLCTGMLKDIISDENEKKKIKMFFRKSNGFNLPKENLPLVLIGPGTGIAPFMGFLEERKMQKASQIIWLFYGCRSKTKDYLFEKELQEYLDLGILTKLCVAFSRDPDAEAKYVQDNIRKYGKELSKLIFEENALVYVCGDAKNMRKDIQISFVEVFENYKGMTRSEATDCMKKLQKSRRYLQDIWI